MATILFTWELGGGLGHLARIRPLVEFFVRQGHVTFLAVRDLRHVQSMFGDFNVQWLQAPFKGGTCNRPIEPPRSFAHVLHNTGFETAVELRGLTQAWRALQHFVQPDLVVHDHSPAAIVAFRGLALRQAIIGTGFCIPPPISPLPDLRDWLGPAADQLAADEEHTLAVINTVLSQQGSPPIEYVAQLYRDLDDQLLTTYPELDLYGPRPHQPYWGVTETTQGLAATWPPGNGPRIFAYFKSFRALSSLLQEIQKRALRAIVFAPTLPRATWQSFVSEHITFTDRSLDMATVRAQCDLAILNGTHGVTSQLLLGGVPALHIPIVLEQFHVARKVHEVGAGLFADGEREAHVAEQLDKMLSLPQFRLAAQKFAARYSVLDPQKQAIKIGERLLQLCKPNG